MSIPLPRSSAAAAGIDPAAIDRFLTAADAGGHGLHSFQIVRGGSVAAEGWWHPYRPELRHMMFSISKSFTATAIGLAQDEGILSVDEPILGFFPAYGTARVRAAAGGVRVRDLLSMATGHETDTFPVMRALPDADWIKLFFDVPFVFPPGTHFLYNTGATYVLAAALAARTGASLVDYLTPRLFEPLGIDVPPWQQSPAGIAMGGTGLRVTTEDIAKLGLLYLQRGAWNGAQVVSSAWVDDATAKHIDNESGAPDWASGYGYQFWRSRHDSYRADGAFAQFSFVLPELDTVIAITAGLKENWRVPDLVWEHLLPGIGAANDGSASVGSAADAAGALAAHIDGLRIAAPELAADGWTSFEGADRPLGFNTLNLRTARAERGDSTVTLILTAADGGEHRITGANDHWIDGETTLWEDDELTRTPTAVRAGWSVDGVLEFHEQCTETVFLRTWRLDDSASDGPTLTFERSVVGSVERSERVAVAG